MKNLILSLIVTFSASMALACSCGSKTCEAKSKDGKAYSCEHKESCEACKGKKDHKHDEHKEDAHKDHKHG